MRHVFSLSVGLLLASNLMFGCARQPPASAAPSTVALTLLETDKYDWRGDQFLAQDLRMQLIDYHKSTPFTAIEVKQGKRPLSEIQKAQLGTLARDLGATAYVVIDGKREEIKLAQ